MQILCNNNRNGCSGSFGIPKFKQRVELRCVQVWETGEKGDDVTVSELAVLRRGGLSPSPWLRTRAHGYVHAAPVLAETSTHKLNLN